MIIKNPNEYVFDRFEISTQKFKKYDAILIHKKTGKEKRVPFGDTRYQQYRDNTGLGKYSAYDHNDKERRKRYKERHKGEDKEKFSSGYFSWMYLW